MAESDYYKVLGVAKDASADAIRKAYKKLAREYHPDSKPDDAAAAEKFKEIQEAYSVLGDPEKREQYNRFGAGFRNAGAGGRGPYQQTWSSSGGPIDLGDIFGAGGGIDLGDLFGGGGFRGAGGFHGAGRQAPRQSKGQDILLDVEIPFHVAAEGGSHSVSLLRDGSAERLNVKIPAGVDTGSVIRLGGQGQPGFNGGAPGDLKLTIKVAPHPWFRRDGANLSVDVPITPTEAALGAKVEVPTLTEGNVMLTIPPGTSSGTKLRLRGKGVINTKTKQRGDQYVIVKIVVPSDLTPEAADLYRQLAEAAPQSPRSGLW